MAVVGVLVEAVVGHEHERRRRLRRAGCAARPARRRRGRRPANPVASLAAGTPKRITPGTPSSASARTSLRRLSCVCCTTPGIDDDRLGRVDAFLHEQRRDEVVDAEPVLGDQPPQRGRAPQPAEATFGERHGRECYCRVRGPNRPRTARSVASTSRSAATRPSMVCGSASTSTRRPRSRGVAT